MTGASAGECSVDRCDRPVAAHGWCSAHYFRWRKHGDVQAEKPIGFRKHRVRQCTVSGCGRVVASRGWCSAHYERWRTYGSVRASVPLRVKSTSGEIVLSACIWVSRHAGDATRKRARDLADRGGRYLVSASGAFLERMVRMGDARRVTDDNLDEIVEWLDRTVDDG